MSGMVCRAFSEETRAAPSTWAVTANDSEASRHANRRARLSRAGTTVLFERAAYDAIAKSKYATRSARSLT
jgi:hypothetical protein